MPDKDGLGDIGQVPSGIDPAMRALVRPLSATLQLGWIDEVVIRDQADAGFTGKVNIQFLSAIGTRKNVDIAFDYVSAVAFDGRIPQRNALVLIAFLPAEGVSGQDKPVIIKYFPPDWDGKLRQAESGTEGGAGGYGGLINKGIDIAGVDGKVKLLPGEYAHVRRVAQAFSYWIMRNDGDFIVKSVKDIVHDTVREIITAANEFAVDSPDIKLGTKDAADLPKGTEALLFNFVLKVFLGHGHFGNMGAPTSGPIDSTGVLITEGNLPSDIKSDITKVKP